GMRDGLNRRDFFRLAGTPLFGHALTGTAGAAEATDKKTLVFAPRDMPASLDPIATPSFASRTAATTVFETLYGTDAALNPMPQMVTRHRMEEDGKVWF